MKRPAVSSFLNACGSGRRHSQSFSGTIEKDSAIVKGCQIAIAKKQDDHNNTLGLLVCFATLEKSSNLSSLTLLPYRTLVNFLTFRTIVVKLIQRYYFPSSHPRSINMHMHFHHEAELEAVGFAATWALEHNKLVNIHTDSQSSIEAIKSAEPKSEFVNSIKEKIYSSRLLVSLVWVKAHAGNPGNERTDCQAKLVSNSL
ncbi:hypothetical protein AVEN_271679-1 [Araneus ventricosus]|uniref:RNase H type-1 domain-containing protein n=1 Tax=Araneus ventricosus TaxID=182803 RepID=A0A4Y2J8I1_ARAVE|nr:hypothetical protein AVEN_271679-1 [Araneus ventricosus]